MSRVLLVDDSGTMRMIIRRSLESLGVNGAVEAADGLQAIQLFRPGQFDLVLTDWKMPGKSGLEVVREIRQQDRAVPILMIATESDRSKVLEAIRAGVSDYLLKPFTTDSLRSKLEKYVQPM
jgi:two-component system chemotaxis response regulator CheY